MSSSELSRIKERSKSRKLINEIYDNAIRTYLIHYSCESLYENSTGGSTRVTSIAIRNLKSAQTKSWSIHKSAELKGQLTSIQQNIDSLEKSMLDGYFSFLETHRDHTFIHWNMRDENYGFAALEHRYHVLSGTPFELNDDKKVDLARELVTLYGRKYAPHTSPKGRKGRLMSIVEMNNIADLDALPGAEEADAFTKGEYLKLHQSTLRKVDILANIFDRIHDKSIKTNADFMDKYGIHPVAILELAKNNILVTGLIFLSSIGIAIINCSRIFAWAKSLLGFV
ncbi:hypothetical protein SAMN04244573_02359 [Azotobacter beijerinckii]|uniref:Uncharacterized protein n=1 Tax=Azotobacter beijerinckii TaxID=170623 RepID=A0A1H9J9Z9_9GAMM|nr:hypothetical protein [Azotobacter beijerinckii]SEQ83841.1 hypothetical protein SAMN04244573_02359 [Azotobacter beijerinckii]